MTDLDPGITPSAVVVLATIAVALRAKALHHRRRRALNRAMHELRRPIQAMALLLPESMPADLGVGRSAGAPGLLGFDPVRQAVDALGDLDHELNGTPRTRRPRELLAVRLMVDACVRRWQAQASVRGASVRLAWSGPDALVRGDATALAAAVENLIVNAIEHGGPRITVGGGVVAGKVKIVVADDGKGHGTEGAPVSRRSGAHGFGLEVAGSTIESHGGRIETSFSPDGSTVEIQLPVARPGRSARGRVKVNW